MMQASMLAWAMGLWPFKDVFESTPRGKINGEKKPYLMGLISATSGGPVAPGDEIGMVNLDIIDAVSRKDGLLYKPDRPMTATDLTYIKNDTYFIASTESKQGDLTWYYTLTINLWPHRVKSNSYLFDNPSLLPTGIGYGLAIPHAKVGYVREFGLALGISREGIAYGSPVDDIPAQILFLIVGPEGRQTDYLRLLARVNQFLKRERDKILAAKSIEEIYQLTLEY